VAVPGWLPPPARWARVLAAACALTLGVVTVTVIPQSTVGTTHSGASAAAGRAGIIAGIALLVAGALAWLPGRQRGGGLGVAGLAGLAWLAADWVGWEGGPPLARSLAMVVEPLFPAFVAHVVMAAPGGRLPSRQARVGVVALYGLVGAISAGRALFRDPFLDPHCWSNCRDNVFLLTAQPPVARVLDRAWTLVVLVAGFLLVGIAAGRLRRGSTTARRTAWPLLAPGLVLGAAMAAHAAALLRRLPEDPDDLVFSTLFQIRGWASAALAAGVVLVLVRGWRARSALARLAVELGEAPAPGDLGRALARATADPGLEVAYPLGRSGRYADASGTAFDPATASAGRTLTPIVRGGVEVALVVHDEAVDAEQIRREIGAAARLAVDNERLQAELLAQLADLRASQVRIVEAADAERRRLERNLHDGAQQRLLALSYDLRLAHSGADGDGELPTLLRSAGAEAQAAVTELRELAHGIYPAVLTESGIDAALWTLADAAPVPVEIIAAPEERFAEAVERTVFVVVAEAVDAAHRLGSSHVEVRVLREGDVMILDIGGAGRGPFVHLEDRVGALGGRLLVAGDRVRAVIPCA
jgi:signal transduction histidine kinase